MHNKLLSRLCLVIMVAVLAAIITDCCGIQTTASVKPILAVYEKTAIIWKGNDESFLETLFLSFWMETFPNQIIVERKDISKVISERDLLKWRLRETTRARLQRILKVDAIVIAHFLIEKRRISVEESNSNLTIKIIDTKTGEISASAISTGSSNCNESIVIEAIRKIREQLDKKFYSTRLYK